MADELVKTGRLVTVFGGSGFVGRHVVRALARDGWRIRVASRRPDLAFHLQPLGRVGQINAVQANVRVPASVAAALRGSDAVVNLAAVLTEKGRQRFDSINVFGARAVASAALDAGIPNFVQMSALGADPESDCAYAKSRASAEAAVREVLPGAIILRPSIVFGPEDAFFNRFATIARLSPVLPLFFGGATKIQPVLVADVAKAAAVALGGGARAGTTYELGGPEIRTFKELMEYICEVTGRKRLLVPVPTFAANIAARCTEIADFLSLGLFPPTLLFTRDQLKLLGHDNVVSATAIAEGRTLAGLGIAPETIEAVVPAYLTRFRKTGQFDQKTA